MLTITQLSLYWVVGNDVVTNEVCTYIRVCGPKHALITRITTKIELNYSLFKGLE